MNLRRIAPLGCMIALLSACSGGGPAGTAGPVGIPAAGTGARTGSGSVTFRANTKSVGSALHTRSPKFVSPATRHANLFIDDGPPISGTCDSSGVCSIFWTATTGAHTFAVETDDGITVLAETSAPVNVAPGADNSFTLTLDGVVAQIVFPTTHTAADEAGYFAIADADGYAITIPGGFDNLQTSDYTTSTTGIGQVTTTEQFSSIDSLGNDYGFSVACLGSSTGTFAIAAGFDTRYNPSNDVTPSELNLLPYPVTYPAPAYISDVYACLNGVLSTTSGTVGFN